MSHGHTAGRGALLGLAAYLLLAGLKLGVGVWGRSRALVADAVNNLSDVAASVAVLVGIWVARQPADRVHRYGHGRAETVAALVVATLMAVAGLEVALGSVRAALASPGEPPAPAAVWVAGGSAAVALTLGQYLHYLGRRTGSHALRAQAHDLLADAAASAAALAGAAGARLGYRWLDPVAGLAVAAFILRTAFRLGAEGACLLMDGFDADRLDRIARRVAAVDGVRAVYEVRARQLGPAVRVDVTIGVDPHLTVAEGHAVAERVEEALAADLGVEGAMVHVEPHGEAPAR